jgi:hypothetical protein
MGLAEQYAQEQCDSAKSDEFQRLAELHCADKARARREVEIERKNESLADCENLEHRQGT